MANHTPPDAGWIAAKLADPRPGGEGAKKAMIYGEPPACERVRPHFSHRVV
jgi:hypothetical protein